MDVSVSIPARTYHEVEARLRTDPLANIVDGQLICTSDDRVWGANCISVAGNCHRGINYGFGDIDKVVYKKLQQVFDDFFGNYESITPQTLKSFYETYQVNVVAELEDMCYHDIFITRFGIKQFEEACVLYPSTIDDPVFATEKGNELLDGGGFPYHDVLVNLTFGYDNDDFDILEALWEDYRWIASPEIDANEGFDKFLEMLENIEGFDFEEYQFDDRMYDLKYSRAYGWIAKNLGASE